MADSISIAANSIAQADALIIGAGAGMGVDSGLPDFRGNQGFWRAYPPLKHLGISFVEMANPRWFTKKPRMAWAFYGHRHQLYSTTQPHDGFETLRRWGEKMRHGAFVFTSNIDGHFQRAGFAEERVCECHGSLSHGQCVNACGGAIWPFGDLDLAIDLQTLICNGPLPQCPRCGDTARPNVLMFGDWGWLSERCEQQEACFGKWLAGLADSRVVLVECGAGQAVPTVRMTMERLAARFEAPLIRINPREAQGPAGTISLAMGAAEGLVAIDAALA